MNPEMGEMADEKWLHQLRRQLKAQRIHAKEQSKESVNKDLESLERAFGEMRVADIQLCLRAREMQRMQIHMNEMLESHYRHHLELKKWTGSFEHLLARQKVDLASRIKVLLDRAGELEKNVGCTDLDRELAAVENDYIRIQMGELKSKMERLKWMLAWSANEVTDETGRKLEFTVHPPSDGVAELSLVIPKYKYLEAMICANVKCGRVKASTVHPLCRNCQKRYKEGSLGGEWTGVIPPEPTDE